MSIPLQRKLTIKCSLEDYNAFTGLCHRKKSTQRAMLSKLIAAYPDAEVDERIQTEEVMHKASVSSIR